MKLVKTDPIRTSIAIIVLHLIVLLLATDLIYTGINAILLRVFFLNLTLPLDIHKFILLLLFILHITKTIFHITLTLVIVIRWINRTYQIEEKQLIKKEGLFSISEKIFDLNNIRSVTVRQSFLGKLFHFGDVTIETSASGGYMDKIVVSGIANPEIFETNLRRCF